MTIPVGSRDHYETISREAGASALIDIILRRSAVSVLPQSRTLSEKSPDGARKFIVKPAYMRLAVRGVPKGALRTHSA